jgi:hypothetical protein
MNTQPSIIKELEARITEIQWYGTKNHFKLEPHLYPNNLFRSQSDPVGRYRLDAYIAEMRADLERIKSQTSPYAIEVIAKQLLQKIKVLVTSFKSLSLRNKKSNPMEALINTIDPEKDSVYQYLTSQQQPPSCTKLRNKIDEYQSDLNQLHQSLLLKQQQAHGQSDKISINNSILEIKKQIGFVEQQITRLKEKAQLQNQD